MKTVFMSMPMGGKKEQQIKQERTEYFKQIEEYILTKYNTGYELVESVIPNADEMTYIQCLGESIKFISPADIFVACPGWRNARGCRIEHNVAKEYGKEILDLEEYGLPVFERKMLQKIKELLEQRNIKVIPGYVDTDSRTITNFKFVRETYANDPCMGISSPATLTQILVIQKCGSGVFKTQIEHLHNDPSQNFNSVLWGVLEQKYENDKNKAKEQAEKKVLNYLDSFKQDVFPRGLGSK